MGTAKTAAPQPSKMRAKPKKTKGTQFSKYSGVVVNSLVSKGSKSERYALQLETDQGLLTLRRPGTSPFQEEEFGDLEGKRIEVVGLKRGSYLYLKDWELSPIENQISAD